MNATDDWYDVSQLTDGSYRVVEGDEYGLFLVEGDERSVAIDAGIGVGDLHTLATDLVEPPITLVLTHTHWDHIGAGAQFDEVLVGPAELPADGRIAVDSLTQEFTQRPTQFKTRWQANGNEFPDSVSPEEYTIEPFEASAVSFEGGVDLGDRTLTVHPLPGHSPGHLGVLDPKTRTLYGGDILHFGLGLYVMFEDSDLGEYVESLDRVRTLLGEDAYDVLATSHNDPLSGEELSVLEKLHEGLREIEAGEREYELVDSDWGTVRTYQVGASEVQTQHDSRR